MVKIGQHVFFYGLFFTVTVGSAYFYAETYGKTEEEKVAFFEQRVNKQGALHLKTDRQNVQAFLNKLKTNKLEDKEEEKLDVLLKKGKGEDQ